MSSLCRSARRLRGRAPAAWPIGDAARGLGVVGAHASLVSAARWVDSSACISVTPHRLRVGAARAAADTVAVPPLEQAVARRDVDVGGAPPEIHTSVPIIVLVDATPSLFIAFIHSAKVITIPCPADAATLTRREIAGPLWTVAEIMFVASSRVVLCRKCGSVT